MLPRSALPRDLGETFGHAGRVLGRPLPPKVETELRKITKVVQRTLRRYGFAGQHGLGGRAASLEYLLSTSFGFRLLAVLHGYPKGQPTITWQEVKDLANEVCPRLAPNDAVLVEATAKSDGGYRPITKSKGVARANQSMVTDILAVRVGHSPYEYARKGRGREELIERIINANRNGGVRALATLDVKDCFLSMRREAAYAVLPISKAIINNTIYISDDTPVVMKTNLISENAVRAGLPQGALCSVIVAGLILRPSLDAIEGPFVASYIDDLTLAHVDEESAKAQLDTLAAKLKEQHPSSPLFEKCSHAFKIGTPADVLGYWLRPNPTEFGGGIRCSPSPKAIRKFYVRLVHSLLQTPISEWEAVIEKRAYAFAASFKHWGGALGGREFLQTVFYATILPELTTAQAHVCSSVTSFTSAFIDKLIPNQILMTAGGLGGPLV